MYDREMKELEKGRQVEVKMGHMAVKVTTVWTVQAFVCINVYMNLCVHTLTRQFADINAVLQEHNRRLVQHRERRHHKSREASETFKDGSGT